ncbi:MAG: glycosyltransferase [Urechidicola sp.]|nr:glycosyltransferase [Urechidicola sp.]
MQLVFVVFIAIAIIQYCYYLFIFSRFSSSKSTTNKNTNIPVSVLICARNEEKNLKEFLPTILEQEYLNFEIVLINDGSYDDTLAIMESFKKKHPNSIKIVNVVENEKFYGSKKYALTLGIKAATNEYLLFTDADCKPNSKHWISEMTNQFSEGKEIVLGYGAYKKIKNSWLNKIIRFETLMTALQYFSYSKIELSYMGVGRNLAYTKSLFFKNNGFGNHLHIKSGDDDLFVNQNATKENISLCFSENSFTISEPKTTFKDWILQKRRHVSTASHYKPIHQFLLGLFYGSQLLFWGLAILLLALNYQWQWIVGVIFIRFIIQYNIIHTSAKKLNERDLVIWAPFLEVFLILIQLFIFIKNLFSKPTHW